MLILYTISKHGDNNERLEGGPLQLTISAIDCVPNMQLQHREIPHQLRSSVLSLADQSH